MAKQERPGMLPVLALFKQFPEFHQPDKYEVIYDLDEWHKVYVELEDLTGYKAAIKLVGDWEEWQRLFRISSKLRVYLDQWNEEIKIKIKSRAINNVLSLSERQDSVGLSAAKWISEEGWDKRRAGRPTKDSVRAERKRLAQEANTTTEELERVMSTLSNANELEQ